MSSAVKTMPESVQHVDSALAALAQIDLRTVRDTDLRNEIKNARSLLQTARKGLLK